MAHLVHDPHSLYGMTSQRVARTSARDGIQRSNPQARQIQGLSNAIVGSEVAAADAHRAENATNEQYDRATHELNLARQRLEALRRELDQLPRLMDKMAHQIFWTNHRARVNEEIDRISRRRDEQRRGLGLPAVFDGGNGAVSYYNDDDAEEPDEPLTEAQEIELQVAAEADLHVTQLEAEENVQSPEYLHLLMVIHQQQHLQQHQQRQFSNTAHVVFIGSRPRVLASSSSPSESQ